ncbi:hypothetical protein BV97_04110 [Novosphingobium resinovorum]|uniref:Uncharacterized protein n=1 Tax=Novosphingobium resinovorum TaxID=158500 RepID=A0A031JSL8_9SPHN|nr:hypothetical protein [Novosphingobium resinovorum]EZP79347.1 hypothetical protein BV97_04110 [Novosphingobium resinovorum]
MPRMTDRERLAKIEADQRTLAGEAETVRLSVRASYAALVSDLPVERLSEREFRDVLAHAVRVGGAEAITAMKAISRDEGSPAPSSVRPAASRKPVPTAGATTARTGAGAVDNTAHAPGDAPA